MCLANLQPSKPQNPTEKYGLKGVNELLETSSTQMKRTAGNTGKRKFHLYLKIWIEDSRNNKEKQFVDAEEGSPTNVKRFDSAKFVSL